MLPLTNDYDSPTCSYLPQFVSGPAHTLAEFKSADIKYHPKDRVAVGFWYPLPDLITYYQRMASGDFGADSQASATGTLDAMLALPVPRTNTSTLSANETAQLAAYMNWEQHKRFGYMGISTCRVCGCLNGTEDVDDGTYVWPSGLAHYVTEHSVGLPPEFVAHCLAGGRAERVELMRGWVASRYDEDVSRSHYDNVAVIKPSPEATKAHIEWAHRKCDSYLWSYDAAEVEATVTNGRISSVRELGPRVRICEEGDRIGANPRVTCGQPSQA